mmetsp:Transcript_32294/g.80437  ORF Transcript_32294/g.80437 Transcript_32294/m.80437 type:complete len:278 (-) Transcript_32294:210-1043(-)
MIIGFLMSFISSEKVCVRVAVPFKQLTTCNSNQPSKLCCSFGVRTSRARTSLCLWEAWNDVKAAHHFVLCKNATCLKDGVHSNVFLYRDSAVAQDDTRRCSSTWTPLSHQSVEVQLPRSYHFLPTRADPRTLQTPPHRCGHVELVRLVHTPKPLRHLRPLPRRGERRLFLCSRGGQELALAEEAHRPLRRVVPHLLGEGHTEVEPHVGAAASSREGSGAAELPRDGGAHHTLDKPAVLAADLSHRRFRERTRRRFLREERLPPALASSVAHCEAWRQ